MLKIRILITALLIAFIIFPYNSTVFAADKDKTLEVYTELFQVTGAEKQYQQIIHIVINQFGKGFLKMINQHIKENGEIPADKKEAAKELIKNYMQNSSALLIAKYNEELPFSELVQNIYIPIYEKYFSLEEIQEIITFYKSPVGAKFVQTTPKLMQEAVQKMNSLYEKKIADMSMQIMKVEGEKLKTQLAELIKK